MGGTAPMAIADSWDKSGLDAFMRATAWVPPEAVTETQAE